MSIALYLYSAFTKKEILFLSSLLLSVLLFAQSADTLNISGIEVTDTYKAGSGGGIIHLQDSFLTSAMHSDNLSSTLQQFSSLNIKSYGSGGISMLNYRGSSSSHSIVEWNGLNLNSVFLGMSDLSLLPMYLSKNIRIRENEGAEALPGAVLALNSASVLAKKSALSLDMAYGSFDKMKVSGKMLFSGKKMAYSLRPYYESAENDYPYRTRTRDGLDSTAYRKFASFETKGLIQEAEWKINKASRFLVHSWLTNSMRDLPSTILSNADEANESLRESNGAHILSFKHNSGKGNLQASLAYRHQLYRYRHLPSSTETSTFYNGLSSRANYLRAISGRIVSSTILEWKNNSVKSDNYALAHTRNEFIASEDLKIQAGKGLTITPILRLINYSDDLFAFLPALNIDWQSPEGKTRWTTDFKKTARVPSFNELYWYPGGNPDLLNEKGYSLQTNLSHSIENDGIYWRGALTLFHHTVKNWISWQPNNYSHFWSPENLKVVRSNGVELNFDLLWKLATHKISLSFGYSYTRAGEDSLHFFAKQQLLYLPKHATNLVLSWKYKHWLTTLAQNFTDQRFTRIDGSAWLPSYGTLDLGIFADKPIRNLPLSASFRLKNITNQQYQMIAWYPMPGREFEISIHLSTNTFRKNDTQSDIPSQP